MRCACGMDAAGTHKEVKAMAQSFAKLGVKYLQHIETSAPVPRNKKENVAYYRIAAHYKFALTTLFEEKGHPRVLILEDDMEVAPDLFAFFTHTAPLLEADPSLLAVSSWNDNGQTQFVRDPEAVYRCASCMLPSKACQRARLLVTQVPQNRETRASNHYKLARYRCCCSSLICRQVVCLLRPQLDWRLRPCCANGRSDFFPGLGWMLTRRTWDELAPIWPDSYWDDWLRLYESRRGKQSIHPEVHACLHRSRRRYTTALTAATACVVASHLCKWWQVCRTYNFGEKGSSKGQFFRNYLKPIRKNEELVDWENRDLRFLLQPAYDKYFISIVAGAKGTEHAYELFHTNLLLLSTVEPKLVPLAEGANTRRRRAAGEGRRDSGCGLPQREGVPAHREGNRLATAAVLRVVVGERCSVLNGVSRQGSSTSGRTAFPGQHTRA
eukprot:scaffold2140_cov394-Prasinococcus_capsulatus_cf.AAC.29